MLKVKKMKNIIFKIKTEYSLETYFLVVNENKLIETQIDDALASIGYCDAYEIENYKEVSKKYAARRNKFFKKYKKTKIIKTNSLKTTKSIFSGELKKR